jgi:hypothetical protein
MKCDDWKCVAPDLIECQCSRCARETEDTERYFTCEEHQDAVTQRHLKVRGRPAQWAESLWRGREVFLTGEELSIAVALYVAQKYSANARDSKILVQLITTTSQLPSGSQFAARCTWHQKP